MMNTTQILEHAIALLGSQAKLGEAAGVSQNAIWHAKSSGRVSAELAVAIERATSGRIARWQLRPDLWTKPSQREVA